MKALAAALALFATPLAAAHELEGRDLAMGEQIYGEQCAACHGVNLEGAPNWQFRQADGTLPAPPHDATGHTWHHDNGLLFNYTKLGSAGALEAMGITDFKSGMPAYAEVLTDEEIWSVLAFIRSTWPAEIQAAQEARNPPH